MFTLGLNVKIGGLPYRYILSLYPGFSNEFFNMLAALFQPMKKTRDHKYTFSISPCVPGPQHCAWLCVLAILHQQRGELMDEWVKRWGELSRMLLWKSLPIQAYISHRDMRKQLWHVLKGKYAPLFSGLRSQWAISSTLVFMQPSSHVCSPR